MHLEAYAHTDVGPVREQNEDSLLIDLDANIFVVADGMGGHKAGEVASAMAVEAVFNTLVGDPDPDETRLVRDHEAISVIVGDLRVRQHGQSPLPSGLISSRSAVISTPVSSVMVCA